MTKTKLGCYADGTFGHQHTRERAADMLEAIARDTKRGEALTVALAIAKALRGEMSDDAEEELDAEFWLNVEAGKAEAMWAWQDGDFGLWPIPEEPEA